MHEREGPARHQGDRTDFTSAAPSPRPGEAPITMTSSNLLHVPTTSHPAIIRDDGAVYTASGMRISPDEVRARRVADGAERWLAFASERTRMRPGTLTRKALASATFSVLHGASSLAVPSKIAGTSGHQQALWTLVREHVPTWTELAMDDTGDGLAVRYEDDMLGEVQPKHLGWVRPLVPFGLTLHLARVTGRDYEGYTLGCNVAFGHVGAALGRFLGALGQTGGDGQQTSHPPTLAAPSPSQSQREESEIPVREEHEALAGDAGDVVLFRQLDGGARISIPHRVTHSPTGVGWGARAGRAGMADLALSVLTHVAGEDVADALATRFVESIASRLPYRGGVLRAADIRRWIARTTTGGNAA